MKKQRIKIFTASIVMSFSFITFMFSPKVYAVSTVPDSATYNFSERLGGKNRYETSVEVSKKGWQNGSDYVLMANGEEYADALCAAPLAKKYDAPILLTSSKELTEDVKNELKRLKAKHIIVIGGNGAISENVENGLKEITVDVQRIYGNSRYSTALEVAKKLGINNRIVVTSGEGFADALSIAPIAAQKGMPILLVGKGGLDPELKDYLKTVQIQKSYIVGGKGIINENYESVLPNVERISGDNRFETNIKIMEAFSDSINFENVYIALGDGPTGKEFADALSGAAIAAKNSAPVILTNSIMPSNVERFIKEKISPSTRVMLLGGKSVVADETYEKIKLNSVFYNKNLSYGSEDMTKPEIINNNADITEGNVEIKNTKIKGNLYINATGAILKNVTVDGNIFVNPGENGITNMDTVTASEIMVLSGAKESVDLKNVKSNMLNVCSRTPVRIESMGTTEIEKTFVTSESILDAKSGFFGEIFVSKSQDHNKIIEFRGSFNKPITITGQASIKAAEGANIPKLKIAPENKGTEIKLLGIFKEVEVNKETKLKIESGKVEKLVTNIRTELEISKNAKVETIDKRGQDVLISGEGKNNINGNITNANNVVNGSKSNSSDKDDDSEKPAKPEEPSLIKVKGNNVEINYKNNLEDTITIVIYKNGTNSTEYVDQIKSSNGEFYIKTFLKSGTYTGKIKAIKTDKFIDIPKFEVK